MNTDATTTSGILHPAVIMIIEGRVPPGGREALEAFFTEAHALIDLHRTMLMRLQWNADDALRFRAVFGYATERDFEPEDRRSGAVRDVVDYRSQLDSLVEAQPVVTIWRETSRQFSEDLIRAYWDLVDAREWDALGGILAPDVVMEWPATGERLDGAANLIAANRDDPDGWTVAVRSIIAVGEHVASDVEQILDDGRSFRVVTLWTVRQHRIVGGTEFRTAVGQAAAPPWRQRYSTSLD
ncbi:MAG: nuclear transport factor 2 family protein [Actinomycetota bacterium]